MARERMVTRCFNYKTVKVLCVDVRVNETVFRKYTYTGQNKTDEGILRALKKEYDNDDITLIKVLSVQDETKLYGMPELDFMAKAVELDPNTRQRIESV